jgi:hypothetical protein
MDGSMLAARITAGSAASSAVAKRTNVGAMTMDGAVPLISRTRAWT